MTESIIIPNNWQKVKVKDISLRIHYGYTASSVKKNTGTKLLRITDIQNYKVDWDEVPFCEISTQDIEKYLLKENDIVFARTGATVHTETFNTKKEALKRERELKTARGRKFIWEDIIAQR